MRSMLPFAAAAIVSLSLSAQSTGRISGKVTTRDGKPVTNAVITLERLDITWKKEIKTDSKGAYLQVGLDPKNFKMTVTAPGFQSFTNPEQKIALGDPTIVNVTLMTEEEARKEAGAKVAAVDPNAAVELAATDAFNQAVGFYNEKNFASALAPAKKAYDSMKDAYDKAKDDQKKDQEDRLRKVANLYATSAFEVGKADEAQRKDLWTAVEPLVREALAKNPTDLRWPTYLKDIAAMKGDAATEKAMDAIIEKVMGPNPNTSYNKGVEFYNDNKFKEAKPHFLRALEIDPKFADAYYMLAMLEFAENNLKATKGYFLKYLEVAPNGKKAGEVSDMLKAPELKNVK